MSREKVNEYFLNLVNDIIKNENVWRNALLCEAGYEYWGDTILINAEKEVICNFNIDIKYGASKLVIISNNNDEYSKRYVVKIPFGYEKINYCEKELEVYNSVLHQYEYFTKYFAECWYAGEVKVIDENGFDNYVPVYIMQRADIDEDRVEESSYSFWLSDGGEPEWYCPDSCEEITNCFKSCYGKMIGESIEEIIYELDITDLHTGNVGFIDGNPVLIDYSGYFG